MLNDLLEQYWEAAYAEGKEGREHDTVTGLAQLTFMGIHAEVKRLVEAEREACAKVCDPSNADMPADWTVYAKTKAECAAKIRKRSNVELRRDASAASRSNAGLDGDVTTEKK